MNSQPLAPHVEQNQAIQPDNEIGLVDFVAFLVRNRLTILVATAACFILSIVYLNVTTYRYTAKLLVVPIESRQNLNLGSLGSLATIAGVNLGPNEGGHFTLYKTALQSREVAELLAQKPEIMRTLFHQYWDDKTESWKVSGGRLREISNAVKFILGKPALPPQAPNAASLQKYLEKRLLITTDKKTNVTTIEFSYDDPRFAAAFLTEVHEAADAMMRQKTLQKANAFVTYLQKELERVQVAEHREALVRLLGEQEKMRMMAMAESVPFSADPFGAVVVSDEPTSPQPLVVLLAGLAGGFILGTAVAVLSKMIASIRLRLLVFDNQKTGTDGPQKM